MGDFSLDDAPLLGRPVEVDSNQIKTLIENNQHYTTWERADILKISKSIKLLVKMKHILFYGKTKLNRVFGHPNDHFLPSLVIGACTQNDQARISEQRGFK